MVVFIIVLIFSFILFGIGTNIYNNLIQLKNNVDKNWKNIDVVLIQRHDELPKLVDTCKGYMKHEQSVLENVTRLRSGYNQATSIDEKLKIENELARQIAGLKVVIEKYPDLKANQNFITLMERITALEGRIADYRETFNDSINIYNITTEKFPDLIVASLFKFERHDFLQVPEESKQDVKINI